MYTEAERQEHIAARIATIERAARFVEETGQGCVHILHQTSIHQHLQDDPTALVAKLRECITSGHTFGAWKGAQQICQAAGLEY